METRKPRSEKIQGVGQARSIRAGGRGKWGVGEKEGRGAGTDTADGGSHSDVKWKTDSGGTPIRGEVKRLGKKKRRTGEGVKKRGEGLGVKMGEKDRQAARWL